MNENEKFLKRKKGIETILDIIFILQIISIILYAILGFNAVELILKIAIAGGLYYSIRLVRDGKKSAGIIALVLGIIELLFAGVIYKIFGILLIIDSIVYLSNIDKK